MDERVQAIRRGELAEDWRYTQPNLHKEDRYFVPRHNALMIRTIELNPRLANVEA